MLKQDQSSVWIDNQSAHRVRKMGCIQRLRSVQSPAKPCKASPSRRVSLTMPFRSPSHDSSKLPRRKHHVKLAERAGMQLRWCACRLAAAASRGVGRRSRRARVLRNAIGACVGRGADRWGTADLRPPKAVDRSKLFRWQRGLIIGARSMRGVEPSVLRNENLALRACGEGAARSSEVELSFSPRDLPDLGRAHPNCFHSGELSYTLGHRVVPSFSSPWFAVPCAASRCLRCPRRQP